MYNDLMMLALTTELVLFTFTEMAEIASRIFWRWNGVSILNMYISHSPSADINQSVECMNLAKFKMKIEGGEHLDYT